MARFYHADLIQSTKEPAVWRAIFREDPQLLEKFFRVLQATFLAHQAEGQATLKILAPLKARPHLESTGVWRNTIRTSKPGVHLFMYATPQAMARVFESVGVVKSSQIILEANQTLIYDTGNDAIKALALLPDHKGAAILAKVHDRTMLTSLFDGAHSKEAIQLFVDLPVPTLLAIFQDTIFTDHVAQVLDQVEPGKAKKILMQVSAEDFEYIRTYLKNPQILAEATHLEQLQLRPTLNSTELAGVHFSETEIELKILRAILNLEGGGLPGIREFRAALKDFLTETEGRQINDTELDSMLERASERSVRAALIRNLHTMNPIRRPFPFERLHHFIDLAVKANPKRLKALKLARSKKSREAKLKK